MLTDAKLRRICARADTGNLLLQQLPKTCQWADILRTSVKHLETAHRVMGLEFCPGAIFTGPEGNGRHSHANALANNLMEKADYRNVISIHGSDLEFENSDDLFDVLDRLEKIAIGSGKLVLLLDQPELSDHNLRFQNQLLRMQQSLLADGKNLFLILIADSADDVAPTLLSRFPRYHCPKPNSETITAFVDNFKNTSTFSNLSGVAAEYVDENLNTIKNNPESNAYLKKAIDCYKEGSYTEEMFTYSIEKWIRIAGPYGGQTITVQ